LIIVGHGHPTAIEHLSSQHAIERQEDIEELQYM
jgi:hypothetical protein